ncbi:MAG: sulfate ABC transporter substrate-binding protein [Polyangiales bacterium]
MAKLALLQAVLLGALTLHGCAEASPEEDAQPLRQQTGALTLLNVSYDPTRELYAEYNKAFAAHWKKEKGQDVTVTQSHGGSGAQAQAVVNGLEADVVTLALAPDVDALAQSGLLPASWQARLPNHSAPYTSTIVFVVRKGNPKGIVDWRDLGTPGVGIVSANPKTSGGARWSYLAAWGDALKQEGGSDATARAAVQKLLANVVALESGARGATTTFQSGKGDVLISWENEAALLVKDGGYEVVTPKRSILAEPPVAVVDKNAEKHGTTALAEAYLKFLYTPEAQAIIAKNAYRPTDPAVAATFASSFPKLELFTIDDVFGGWAKAHATHFADGGTFDQLAPKKP